MRILLWLELWVRQRVVENEVRGLIEDGLYRILQDLVFIQGERGGIGGFLVEE